MFKLKRFFGIMMVLLALVMVAGCDDDTAEQTNGDEAEVVNEDDNGDVAEETDDTNGDTAEGSDDMPTQDRAGIDMTIPEEINGIISLAPSITITLIDLGLEDQIIAIDTQSAAIYGNEQGLPEFDMLAPEVESLIALNPDFVFASDMIMMGNEENDPLQPLRDLEIGVAYIPSSDSIADIQEDLRFTATVVGESEAGEDLIAEMDREIEEIVALVGDVETAPIVYFEIAPAPEMFSFGSGVFLHEMIELIGAENVFGDEVSWLGVEAESIVALNPDVIFTNVNFIDDPIDEILERPGWEGMDAIVNERVYLIDTNDTSQPTHHITRGLRAMAEYLYDLN